MTTSPTSELQYIWIDLELTGLETELDDIVEFGVIGTTKTLDVLFRQKIVVRPTAHGLDRIYAQPPVLTMHQGNGLLAELEAGRYDSSLSLVGDAEKQILAMIDSFPSADTLILAGSGVWHCDLRFLQRHTPTLAAKLDRREIMDVGTFRRAYKRATGRDLTEANTGKNHRADVDIQCSLDEGHSYFNLFRRNEMISA